MPHGTARLPYLWREPSQSPTTAKFASISHNFVKGARDNAVQFLLINWPLWCLVEFGPRSMSSWTIWDHAATPTSHLHIRIHSDAEGRDGNERREGERVAWYHHVLADWYCRRSLYISTSYHQAYRTSGCSVTAYIPACIPVAQAAYFLPHHPPCRYKVLWDCWRHESSDWFWSSF